MKRKLLTALLVICICIVPMVAFFGCDTTTMYLEVGNITENTINFEVTRYYTGSGSEKVYETYIRSESITNAKNGAFSGLTFSYSSTKPSTTLETAVETEEFSGISYAEFIEKGGRVESLNLQSEQGGEFSFVYKSARKTVKYTVTFKDEVKPA